MRYQAVPMLVDLIKTINETNSFTNKIQIDHFGSGNLTAQDDHSNNNEDDSQT